MKILGIDSSGTVASAAVLADGLLAAEFTVNNGQTHSQTLLPMVEEAVERSGVSLGSLDAIAVAAGPGSFTGLRIGSSTAKGMALALERPIVPVPTLEGLAYRIGIRGALVCPMLDARRRQVYAGIYRIEDEGPACVLEQCAAPVEEICEKINQLGERVILLGDGIPIYREYLRESLTAPWEEAPVHLHRQSAAAVAALGEIYYRQGRVEKDWEHRPIYLRKSQAEREREQRLGAAGEDC